MARLPGRTLPEQIAAFRAKAVARLHATTHEAMAEVGQRVIAKTPIRTGLLASNWNYATGAADLSVSEIPQERVLHGEIPAKAAGLRHFISNGVHYGPFVEHGTSRMAPRAMVALTVVEFDTIVRDAAAQAKAQIP